jgi:hypothetical protein
LLPQGTFSSVYRCDIWPAWLVTQPLPNVWSSGELSNWTCEIHFIMILYNYITMHGIISILFVTSWNDGWMFRELVCGQGGEGMNHFQCHWSPYLHSWNGHLWPRPIIESNSSLWSWCIWSHQHVVIVGKDFFSKSFNIKIQQWICLEIKSIGTLDKMFQTNLSPNLSLNIFKVIFWEVPPCRYSCIHLGQSDKSNLTMESCNHVSHMITNVIIDGVIVDPCFWHSDLKIYFALKSLYCR